VRCRLNTLNTLNTPNTPNTLNTHDFNGDGISDVLWRDTSNNIGLWLINGASILQTKVLNAVPSSWAAIGQRDFNGDGKSDLTPAAMSASG
jgi:hypothetical protein